MNNISASIGLANLQNIEERIGTRIKRANFFTEQFKNFTELSLSKIPKNSVCSYWFFPLRSEKRNQIIKKLRENKIAVSVVNQGIDKNTIFGGKQKNLINQRIYDNTFFALPLHDNLNEDEIKMISRCLSDVLEEIK